MLRVYLAVSKFVFGQADRRLIDLVADVTLVLPDIRTVLRVCFHVVFQLRPRLAVLVAVRTVQAHLAGTSSQYYIVVDRPVTGVPVTSTVSIFRWPPTRGTTATLTFVERFVGFIWCMVLLCAI